MQYVSSVWWFLSTLAGPWDKIKEVLGVVATIKSAYDLASSDPSTRSIARPAKEGGGFINIDISEFYYTRRVLKYTRWAWKKALWLFVLLHSITFAINVYNSVVDERVAFKEYASGQTDTNKLCLQDPGKYKTPALRKACDEAKQFIDSPFTPSFYWNIFKRIGSATRSCGVVWCSEIQGTAKASTKYFLGWLAMTTVGILFYGLLAILAYDIIHYLFLSTEPRVLKNFEKPATERRPRPVEKIIQELPTKTTGKRSDWPPSPSKKMEEEVEATDAEEEETGIDYKED